ncbi:MAG TPA: hypothetical protein VND93_02495 [Myxococcales bacterium]|nr:hypothetical protein [Myxococcales bacterium]
MEGLTLPPGTGDRMSLTMSVDESFDVAGITGLAEDAAFEAKLVSVEVTDRDGRTLEWIDEASATLHAPAGALPAVTLRYARANGAPPTRSITVPGSDADLAPYLLSGRLRADLSFSGTPPRPAAVLDAKICFEVSAALGQSQP